MSEPMSDFNDYMGEYSKAFRKAGKLMNAAAITQYYDDLIRLAVSKCGSQTDAEDLVGDTILAAFSYMKRGGTIEYPKTWEYAIQGGYRTSESFVDDGTRRVRLYEFDTTLWDSPHRYGGAFELYFRYIIPLLWCIYTDKTIENESEIPNEFISYIPSLERFGMLGNAQDKLRVAIPVLKESEYEEVNAAIRCATERLKTAIGEDFSAFVSSKKTPVPKHLTSVPDLFRYGDATNYFAMAVVREAYEKGLHLKDVDYCCPPVVMTYYEAERTN